MRLGEVTADGSRRLKGSFCAAASLCFAVGVAYVGFLMTGRLVTAFFDTLFFRADSIEPLSVTAVIGTVVTVGLSLLLLSPFRLNIKAWYQGLDGDYYSLRNAFTVFTGFRRYANALWFTIVRCAALFLTFLVPLMPSLVITAVLKISLERGGEELGALSGIFLLLLVLLTLLSLLFSLYMAMGYFFADYLYVLGTVRNPFRCLTLSWRLMRGGRPRLLRLFGRLLPYYLLCLLIAPVPFAVPNIRSALAVYAADEIAHMDSSR